MWTESALVGLCAALLPPEHGGPRPEVLAERVGSYLARTPRRVDLAVRAGATAIDTLALVRHGHRLASLDPAVRAGVLDRLAARSLTDPLVQVLKATVLLVASADAYTERLLERSTAHPPAREDGDLDVTAATDWPHDWHADAVVVGSGAGGAMAARTLARAGLAVVVVEEGPRFTVDEFRQGHPLDRFSALYRDGGATMALGRPPILLPLGRGVGGTTLVNSGTCYRTPESVLRSWRDRHGLAVADPDSFAGYLDEVERTLQVAPVPEAILGRNGALLMAGARALGLEATPLRRNAPGCGGCCQCAIGCPRNAKFGVHLNALPDACAAGARIVSEARVLRVAHDSGRATGVEAQRLDGSRFRVLAPRVVVAAGATETVTLLRRSGLGRHPRMGRNLALHPAVGIAGRFAEPVVAWEGVLQSTAVEALHEGHGILIEATATPPGMGSMALPGHGADLLGELARADHLASVGAMVADQPSGRIWGRRGRTFVGYRLGRQEGHRLLTAMSAMGRLLFAAGAFEVLTGLPTNPLARDQAQLDDTLTRTDPRRLHLAAFHPSGTAAAGSDPQRHPVAADGALRGVEGVWVADASVLPSSPTVNPQVSIMALALAIADSVTGRRSAE